MGWCAPHMQRCTARLSVQDGLCRLLQLRLANWYRHPRRRQWAIRGTGKRCPHRRSTRARL